MGVNGNRLATSANNSLQNNGLLGCSWQPRASLGNRLFSNTKPAEDHPQQIIAGKRPGDAVQRLLRQPQLFGKQVERLRLLVRMVRRRGEVLPRSLIASQVWDMNFDSDSNVIEVAMRRLRAKVDDGFEPKLIRTVRGMGYVMEIAE